MAFLLLNDVPQPIIRKLSSTKQIYLRDAKAKTHWMSCVDVMITPAKRAEVPHCDVSQDQHRKRVILMARRSSHTLRLAPRRTPIVTLINLL